MFTFDAPSFLIGFLVGCFFSLVLSTFLAWKVGQAVLNALRQHDKEKEDDDPANFWKRDYDEDDRWKNL
jgi:hypothetical protein